MERNELCDFLVEKMGSKSKYFHITAISEKEWLINYRNNDGDSKVAISEEFGDIRTGLWFKVKFYLPENVNDISIGVVQAELNSIRVFIQELLDSKREWRVK